MEQIFNLSSGHVLFIQDSSEATFDYTIYSKPSLNDIDGGVYGEELYTDTSITIDVYNSFFYYCPQSFMRINFVMSYFIK